MTVQNLAKTWDNGDTQFVALDPVSHRFQSGHFTCLLGPSGCGKSTLIKLIGGLETPSAGTIQIIDPVTGSPQRVGTASVMMWQSLNLFVWRNVIDNVAFSPEVEGVGREERYASANAILTMVGLQKFAKHFPRQLSGGMRQRVALARALMTGRPIFLMDEPFAALDALTRRRMQDELLQLWQDTKFTVLFVTHSIAEAIRIGNRILLLSPHPGRVKAEVDDVETANAIQGGATKLEAQIHDLLFMEEESETAHE